MKKMVMIAALLFTAGNITVGVYAARCEGRGGGRICGEACSKSSSGDCYCEGSCSSADMNWVSGQPPPGPIAEEVYDY